MPLKPAQLREKLSSGVISFPVTPFKKNLGLDLAGHRKNVRFILKHNVAAVVAPAGTGEMYSLSPEEHQAVVKATLEEVNGQVPVLTGVGFNYPIAIELTRQSTKLGVDGILALPPYFPNSDAQGLADYYKAIGKATKLGLLVYSRDWVNPSPKFVEQLAKDIPNLIAWKDGTGDIRKYQMIKEHVGNRLLWIGGAGDDAVPAYYSIGVRTYTSSIATISPKLSIMLHEAAAEGRREELAGLMSKYVTPLYAFRARRKGYEVSAMKSAMDFIGLAGGPCRPPLPDLKPEEVTELYSMLKAWKEVL